MMTVMHQKWLLFGLLVSLAISVFGEETVYWISPTTVSSTATEDFSAARGVWSEISVGAAGRTNSPVFHINSKGSMWIFGGSRDIPYFPSYVNAIWNYDPVTDRYRWVAGNATISTEQFFHLGEQGVPSDDNFPGFNSFSAHAIDLNDNIWIYGGASEVNHNKLWMFNTTSLQFTWIGGDESTGVNYGDFGVSSPEYWPGTLDGSCMVVDSQNNLWMVGGYYASFARSGIWRYNTTSRLWSLQHGEPLSTNGVTDFATNYWPGRRSPACTIDEDDRVWIFGGYMSYSERWNDMWSFDTKTNVLRVERGLNASYSAGSHVSFDTFDVDNFPASRDRAQMVDRRDGTLMVFGGSAGLEMAYHDIWVFDKATKLWKVVYGEANDKNLLNSTYGEYRGSGSKIGSRVGYSSENGLNSRGNLVIFGGENWGLDLYNDNKGTHKFFNDIWFVPREQCESGLHDCDPNANCTMVTWTYECTCKEGYIGDGKTCTLPTPENPTSGPGSTSGPSSSQSPSRQPSGLASIGPISHAVNALLFVLLCFLSL